MIKPKDPGFKVAAIPTGSLALDYAIGKGGWPMGVIVQVYGARDVGKSSLVGLNAVRNAQAMGLKAVWIAIEAGFDYKWAELNGVDIDEENLLVLDPTNAEEAFGLLYKVVTSNAAQKQEIGVVIFDSVGAVLSEGEMDEDGKMKMGGQSGLITYGIKKVQKAIERNNILAIVINQIRDNLNSPIPSVKPSGPHALHHHSNLIVHLQPKHPPFKTKVNGDDIIIGYTVIAKIKRSKKTQGSDQVAFIDYYIAQVDGYPFGIDVVTDVVNVSRKLGLKSLNETSNGRWEMDDGTKIHGAKQLRAYLEEHPEFYNAIKQEVNEAILKNGGKLDVWDGPTRDTQV